MPDENRGGGLEESSKDSPIKILEEFLKDNSEILTLIGVFGATTVYLAQEFPWPEASDFRPIIYLSGIGILSLLILIVIRNFLVYIRHRGGVGNPSNILLFMFILLSASFLSPVFSLIPVYEYTFSVIGLLIFTFLGAAVAVWAVRLIPAESKNIFYLYIFACVIQNVILRILFLSYLRFPFYFFERERSVILFFVVAISTGFALTGVGAVVHLLIERLKPPYD